MTEISLQQATGTMASDAIVPVSFLPAIYDKIDL